MGCDIHIHAERRNPATKEWEKVGKEFLSSWYLSEIGDYISSEMGLDKSEANGIAYRFAKGIEPTNKLEKYIMGELLPPVVLSKDSTLDWFQAKQSGKLANPYTDRPYDGRCYSLFGVLAGVRDQTKDPISLPRDLPVDVSDYIRDDYEGWGWDAHSSSYYYLYELLDSKYRNMSIEELREKNIDPYFFKTMLDYALEIVEDPRDLRFVFWFDN
jgi:hypothetical protein